MEKLKRVIATIALQEDGVTGMEYALLGALIAVVIIASVAGVGSNLNTLFLNVANQVGNAISGAL